MNSESDLLTRARQGDHAAGEELFLKYLKQSKSIQGLLQKALPNSEDREDMLHEIYLQLISGRHTFRGEAMLSTYIFQVARITLFQKFRRENTLKRGKVYRRISEPVELADGIHSNPEYTYSVREARQITAELIERLPVAYQEAIRLRILEDFSYEEIAQRLNLPLNTVSTKIHKGKKLLSVMFRERGLSEVFDI